MGTEFMDNLFYRLSRWTKEHFKAFRSPVETDQPGEQIVDRATSAPEQPPHPTPDAGGEKLMTCGDGVPDMELNAMCTTLACMRMQLETKLALNAGAWSSDTARLWADMGMLEAKVFQRKAALPKGKLAF